MNNALPPCAPNLVDDAVTRKSLPSLILPKYSSAAWRRRTTGRFIFCPCESLSLDIGPRPHGIGIGHAVGQSPLEFGPLPLRQRRLLDVANHTIPDCLCDPKPLFDAEAIEPKVVE